MIDGNTPIFKIDNTNMQIPIAGEGIGLKAATQCYVFIVSLAHLQNQGQFNFPSKIKMEMCNEYSNNPNDKMILDLPMDNDGVRITLENTIMFMLGTCFQQANNEMESKFGRSKKTNNPDKNIEAIRAVCFSVRCASAHGAGKAEWFIEDKYYAQQWNIDIPYKNIKGEDKINSFIVDLTNKNGLLVSNKDFGGNKNIYLMFDFILNKLLI